MNNLDEVLKVADIHVNRIEMALNGMEKWLPLDSEKIMNFGREELLMTDMLINRFGKLQDLLGGKIIDKFLLLKEENIDHLTMVDKINKLERLGIIEDAKIWKMMRDARNHATHEYPDNPNLTSEHLNEIIAFIPKLISILNNIKAKI